MDDLDEDVVLEGSALHEHLVNSGYTDMEVQGKETYKEGSLAAELIGVMDDLSYKESPERYQEK